MLAHKNKPYTLDDPEEAHRRDSHWSSRRSSEPSPASPHQCKTSGAVRRGFGRQVLLLEPTASELSEHSGVVNNSSTFWQIELPPTLFFLSSRARIFEVNDEVDEMPAGTSANSSEYFAFLSWTDCSSERPIKRQNMTGM